MKAKMDEIDEIWVIYKRNLDQNSRWNINLLLKINFSCWIKNWEQSDRWIAILPLELHLGRQINTGVIWAIRSCCMKEGKYHQKISDISPIYHRYISNISPIYHRFFAIRGDFFKKSPIYLPEPIYRRYIADILVIFTEISLLRFFSMKYRVDSSRYTLYRRYIADISRYFPPWSQDTNLVCFYFIFWLDKIVICNNPKRLEFERNKRSPCHCHRWRTIYSMRVQQKYNKII